jgi:hypothetical protein
LGNNLSQVCRTIRGGGGPVNNLAIVTSPEGTGIGRQLQSPIVSKEEKLQTELDRRAYTMNTSEQFVHSDTLQLPPAGGTSPDIVFGLGWGANVFLSAGAYALNHDKNRYEDGYEAQLPTVTVGADYRINDWLLAGLALNYTNYDGSYDNGGGFDKNIFGPLLYATFLPFEGAFANVVLGYARQENRNNRLASASSCGLPGQPGQPCGGEEQTFSEGHTSADYSENQYTAGILSPSRVHRRNVDGSRLWLRRVARL